MSIGGSGIGGLPHALRDTTSLAERMAGNAWRYSLDCDGTLTPIVDRPEDAIISDRMREVVRGLARRCTVGVVSGRDRGVVQQLMGVDDMSSPAATALTSARKAGQSSAKRAPASRIRSSASPIRLARKSPQ